MQNKRNITILERSFHSCRDDVLHNRGLKARKSLAQGNTLWHGQYLSPTERGLKARKKETSKWIKTKGKQYENFYWQDGYSIFSVNPSEIETVITYINNQEEHHKKRTFQEELLTFLKKYNVEYDERYLWL
jgi:REP element-mobilizing transposase RayT